MPHLAAISLTVPAMLGGLALLGLPILAHLLHRRARRRIVFPSVELLVASSASHASLFRLRRWLLLALRCAAVALLVLAFAQPLWIGTPAEAEGQQRGSSVVLLVDVSLSAGQSIGGVTALDTLRPAAGRVLDGLSVGTDRANLVVGTARPYTVFPQMTANLDAVRAELAALAPTTQRMDLPAALGLAGEALAQADGARHLVVLTDLQRTNWEAAVHGLAGGSASAAATRLPEGTRVTLIPLDAPPPTNLGLSHGRCTPTQPIAGRVARLSARVTNHAPSPQRPEVRLILDGKAVGSATVELAPGEAREVAFEVTPDSAGDQQARFVVGRDAMTADNELHLVVRSVERQPVLIVTDSDPAQVGSAGYFLLRALSPRGGADDSYDTRVVTNPHLDSPVFAGVGVVFVADVGSLNNASARALARFVVEGGSVVYLGGGGPVAENLRAIDAELATGLSPWALGPRQDLARHGTAAQIAEGLWRSPELGVFDTAGRDALGRITFDRVWPATQVAEDARVLLRFADGTPAMAERSVAGGRFVATAFGVGSDDGALSKHGAFVALVQHLTQALRPRLLATDDLTVGQGVAFTPPQAPDPAGGPIVVVGPDRRPIADARVALEGQRAIITIDQITEAGFYAALQAERPLGQFAVNVDARESDLSRMQQTHIADALLAAGYSTTTHDAADSDPALRTRGTPLWGWMLVIAMGVLAVELLLLGVWRR